MLEQEIQKLTAAIEALTATMREQQTPRQETIPKSPDKSPDKSPAPKIERELRQTPATLAPEPDVPADADPAPGCTREGLKEISLQIVRADTSKKKEIVDILEKHGAPTITKLADSEIHAVHGKFLALAHQVAREAKE